MKSIGLQWDVLWSDMTQLSAVSCTTINASGSILLYVLRQYFTCSTMAFLLFLFFKGGGGGADRQCMND